MSSEHVFSCIECWLQYKMCSIAFQYSPLCRLLYCLLYSQLYSLLCSSLCSSLYSPLCSALYSPLCSPLCSSQCTQTLQCTGYFAVYNTVNYAVQWIEEKDLVRHGLKGELLLWSTTHRFVEDQGLQNPMFLPVLWFRATEPLRSKNHLKSFSPTHDFTEMQSKGNKLASLEATLVWNYNSLTRLIINYSQG